MDISPVQLLGSIFGGGAGGGLLAKGLEFLAKKSRSQAYTMGAVDHAVQTAMSSVTGQLERTEGRLELVEAQHENCERNLREVRDDLDESKRQHAREREELKAEIERLMRAPIAEYVGRAPRDPVQGGGK